MRFSQTTQPQACREWTTFAVGQYVLCGYSRSADKTFFYCRTLDVAFDAGCCYGHQTKVVLVTHGHSDHVRDLGYLATKEGCSIFCPAVVEPFVIKAIEAEAELGTARPMAELRRVFTTRGVNAGDRFALGHLKQTVNVVVYAMSHAVPCVGYGVLPQKKKLKEAYRDVAGSQLGKLRKEGVEIEDVFDDYASGFVYFGDTGIEGVTGNEELLRYGTWIVECTFFRPVDGQLSEEEIEARCKRDGHIYWPQLEPIVRANPGTKFVLIHFSLRYSKEDIVDFFEKLPYANITVVACKYSDQ